MDDKHTDNWHALNGALFNACPSKPVAYALVAVGENGEVYWGASYGGPDKARAAIVQWAGVIARDVKDYQKRENARIAKANEYNDRKAAIDEAEGGPGCSFCGHRRTCVQPGAVDCKEGSR